MSSCSTRILLLSLIYTMKRSVVEDFKNVLKPCLAVADPGARGRGGGHAPGPVKISHKKDGRRRCPHRFHVLSPPPYSATGSATALESAVWAGLGSSGSSGCQEEAKNSKSHDIVKRFVGVVPENCLMGDL